MMNGKLRAEINSNGQIISLKVNGDNRDVFQKSDGTQTLGNNLVIYDDQPLYYDAWDIADYHLETGKIINENSVCRSQDELYIVA